MNQEKNLIGAIDQGTTGTRFMVFDHGGQIVSSAYREHRQIFPQPGWVEHDPEEIWKNTLEVISEALANGSIQPARLAAIGITNQRETTVLWEKETGRPIENAIVWQDRRTADRCRGIRQNGLAPDIALKTGLPPDPYFSATKIEWILKSNREWFDRAGRGEILFGNIDAWLIWKLVERHVTDVTNASRTLLFNLETLDWDEGLLKYFDIPRDSLPEVRPSVEIYGSWKGPEVGDLEIPVAGDLGDQQAALFGQAGFSPGDMKNTYGTGSFVLKNTGRRLVRSRSGLLSTVAYGPAIGSVHYALEGSVFVTGAAIQWLRDGLGIISEAGETEPMAESVADTGGVYLVPAFVGLGAPYWNPYAKGTLVGLTGGTTRAHLARAALEAIAYQTRHVMQAMKGDEAGSRKGETVQGLRVDGGAVKNDFLCQFQADILGVPVLRPKINETTALGAAYTAGLAVGFWNSTEELKGLWKAERVFEPKMSLDQREELYANWKHAVEAALFWAGEGKG